MRRIPIAQEAHLNPNDRMSLAAKKQFLGVNQHYLSHHAVLPPYDLAKAMDELKRKQGGRDSPLAAAMAQSGRHTPYMDPNEKVAVKPN